MFDDYIPLGHVTVPRAAVMLAKAAHPDRWQPDALSKNERQVWVGLMTLEYGPDIAEHYLGPALRSPTGSATAERLHDYRQALVSLRQALGAGLITAYVTTSSGGSLLDFGPETWRGDLAAPTLASGYVAIVQDDNPRVLHLPLAELIQAFRLPLADEAGGSGASEPASTNHEPDAASGSRSGDGGPGPSVNVTSSATVGLEALKQDGRKPARFALFLVERHGGTKPPGLMWPDLRAEFLAWNGTPKGSIDEKTMREGRKIADRFTSGNRETPGIPDAPDVSGCIPD